MAEHQINGISNAPNYGYLLEQINASDMSNKEYRGCTFAWDDGESAPGTMVAQFDGELSAEDAAAVEAIVDDASGRADPVVKTRGQIMAEVLAASEPVEQLPRLLDALDKYPSMPIALDNGNYSLARSRVDKALADEAITQADHDLIVGIIPAEE